MLSEGRDGQQINFSLGSANYILQPVGYEWFLPFFIAFKKKIKYVKETTCGYKAETFYYLALDRESLLIPVLVNTLTVEVACVTSRWSF